MIFESHLRGKKKKIIIEFQENTMKYQVSKNPSNKRTNPLPFPKLSNFQKNINPTLVPSPRYNRITLPRLSYRTAPTPIHPSRSILVNHPTLYSPLGNFSSTKSFESSEVNTASIKRGLDSIRAFVPLIRRTREVMRGHRAYCPLASGHSWSQ